MHSDRSSAQWTHPVDVPTDLVFSTFLGGSEYDFGRGIAMDGAGSAYATGYTDSSSFPTTPGAFDPSLNGYDAFIVKLNPTGSGLIYATFLGGNDGDLGQAIALDGARNVYVTGETYSDDFPTTPSAFDQSYNGYGSSCVPYPPRQPCPDVFVAKLNSTGNILTYATYLGGIVEDYSESIAVDHAGSAYVTGWTASSDFPTTPGAFDQSYNGDGDVFVAKLNTMPYAPKRPRPRRTAQRRRLCHRHGCPFRLRHRPGKPHRHRDRPGPHLSGRSVRHGHNHRRCDLWPRPPQYRRPIRRALRSLWLGAGLGRQRRCTGCPPALPLRPPHYRQRLVDDGFRIW